MYRKVSFRNQFIIRLYCWQNFDKKSLCSHLYLQEKYFFSRLFLIKINAKIVKLSLVRHRVIKITISYKKRP